MTMLFSLPSLVRLLIWIFVISLSLGVVAGGHLVESPPTSPVTACVLDNSTGEEVC